MSNAELNSQTPPNIAKPVDEPTLAVMIPTLNRPHDLLIAVRTLLDQTRLPQELIIIDQSTSDESERQVRTLFAERMPKFELRYTRDPGISGLAEARNVALVQNRCSVILFLDDDVELEADFVERLLEGYADDPGVTGISGIITNYKPGGFAFRTWQWVFVHGSFRDDRQPIYYRADELLHAGRIEVSRLGGGLMSFRSDRIRDLHFDSNLRGPSEGEDVDFCLHLPAGAKLQIDPRARLVHNASTAARKDEHWNASVVRGSSYLFYRNWRRGIIDRIAFVWLMSGFGLLSLAASMKRLSVAPWKEFTAALRYGREVGTGAR